VVTRDKLKIWAIDALNASGGAARVPEIAKHIWEQHEPELRKSGDLFYTWRYAMCWAGQILQKEGKLNKNGPNRQWVLK
jgi:hypothetical protein